MPKDMLPLMWGVSSRFLALHRGCSLGSGSGTHTSRAAPASRPSFSASTSASSGYGGIAYLKLQTEVNFSGGTFTGNEASPLTGARGDGITLRSPGTKYTATVNLNKLNQDITLLLYDQSKSLNNTWAVITGPLTHTVTVYSQYPTDGFVVAKGTEDYTLTEADLAKLIPTAEGVTFRLDTENNAICISAG